jgi:hypothetical protein
MSDIKMFKIASGEMVMAEIKETTASDCYVVSIPLTIVPIPPEHAGGAENQVGFMRFLPFSNYSEEIRIYKHSIVSISMPEKQLLAAYEDFSNKFKAKQAGIFTPTPQQASSILNKKTVDFSKLNLGG